MLQETSKIWMDGTFVDWKDATVHVLTHTLHYGLGVFEGIRCYKTVDGPAVFRLAEHVERLYASAHICGMKIPFTKEEFSAAILETLRVNQMEAGYIRPLIYVGYGAMGVYPGRNPIRAAIAVWPWGAYLGDEGLEKGIRVKTASFTRQHVNISMTKAKVCGNYTNSIMGKVEAISDGYDEALLLDATGHVAEGSGENIFIVRRGALATTPRSAILEGITRDAVLTHRRRPGDRGAGGVLHPRPALHRRRGLLHRHGRRDHPDPRGGPPDHRRRRPRAGDEGRPGGLLQRGARREPEVPLLADARPLAHAMPRILPFRGVRYDPARVPDITRVTAPPYDMISAGRAGGALPARPAQRRAPDPRPRAGGRPPGRPLRERGGRPTARWRAEGVLAQDPADSLYLYREDYAWAGRSFQRLGLIARVGARRVRRRGVRPRVDDERAEGRPAAAAAGLRGELQPDLRPVLRPRRLRRGAAARRDRRAAAGLLRRRPGRRAQPLARRRPGADRAGRARASRASRSSSPTATTATRPRWSTAG